MKNRRKTKIIPVPVIQEQIRKEEVSFSKELGKYLLDVSKLVIGGAVITSALQLNADYTYVMLTGVSISITLCILGFSILTIKKK